MIARLADRRADPEHMLNQLDKAEGPGVRAGLILAMGSYPAGSIPKALKPEIRRRLLKFWQDDPNCFVHSASEWALRSSGTADTLAELRAEATKAGRRDGYGWYVSPEGYTLAVIEGPVDARLGSPPTEAGRDSDESQVERHIDRTFCHRHDQGNPGAIPAFPA